MRIASPNVPFVRAQHLSWGSSKTPTSALIVSPYQSGMQANVERGATTEWVLTPKPARPVMSVNSG